MKKEISLLCVGCDSGWKIRLRDLLRETFYRPRIRQCSTITQCIAELQMPQRFTAVIVRASGNVETEEELIDRVAALNLPYPLLMLASLPMDYQSSYYI